MAKFYFTNKAVDDLNQIWNYTLEAWSENQADLYFNLIMNSCKELSLNPLIGKSYEIIDSSILGFNTGKHIIFYRILTDSEIEIVRILHGMMDLKNNF